MTKKKMMTSVGLASMLFVLAALPSSAQTRNNFWGNGSDSNNSISFRSDTRNSIVQSNNADFNNDIRVNSNTGGNEASKNTRGDIEIRTGNSDTHVGVSNFANFNWANINNRNGSWFAQIRDNNQNQGMNDSNNHDYDKNSNHDNDSDHDNNWDNDKSDYNHGDYKGSHDEDSKNGYNHDNGSDYGYDESKSDTHWTKLQTSMNGSKEVPGPGDPDGWGYAKVATIPTMGKVCVAMQVGNIDPANGAHIHRGEIGVAGPVVVPLPVPDSNGYAKGCVDAEMNLVNEIEDNPSNFYINIHNAPYPNGAVRGQLSY